MAIYSDVGWLLQILQTDLFPSAFSLTHMLNYIFGISFAPLAYLAC